MFRPRSKQKQKVAFFKKFLPRPKLKGHLTSAHLGTSYSPALASVCINMLLKKSTPRFRQDKTSTQRSLPWHLIIHSQQIFVGGWRSCCGGGVWLRDSNSKSCNKNCSFSIEYKQRHIFVNFSSGIHDTPSYLIFEPGNRSGTSCDRWAAPLEGFGPCWKVATQAQKSLYLSRRMFWWWQQESPPW